MQKHRKLCWTLLIPEQFTALGRIGGKLKQSDSLTNFNSAELRVDFQINLRSKAVLSVPIFNVTCSSGPSL